MNKVILLGNVGGDPEMRLADGVTTARFRLATTERRRTRDAEGKEIDLPPVTEWHNIVMTGRAAQFAELYVRKGIKMMIEGKLRTRSWEDRNAIKRYITEIYADSFELLPRSDS
ncbi:MAG: single-stranded DNA-binding protein [Muribaculaceae bacterium]|nr:single-stranded DNA-binding protein [Muribaculaceae bacterium]